MPQLEEIAERQFILQILGGRRVFKNIKLKSSNLDSHSSGGFFRKKVTYVQLQEYLSEQNEQGKLEEEQFIFSGSDFTGLQAKGLVMPYMEAEGTCFDQANLTGASLRLGYFLEASFKGTNLTYVDLSRSSASQVDFAGSTLENTDISLYKATGASFKGLDLRTAKICKREDNPSEMYFNEVDFRGADLRGQDFRHMNLYESDFRGAIFETEPGTPRVALFAASNLKGAKFGDATLYGANFRQANLQDVDFTGASLQNASFWLANCTSVIFEGADLTDTDLVGVELVEANLRRAKLSGMKLVGEGFISGTKASANVDRADFRDTDVSGVPDLKNCSGYDKIILN